MKYILPVLNFALAATPYVNTAGVTCGISGVGAVAFTAVFFLAGLITAAWAYNKPDMPLLLTNKG